MLWPSQSYKVSTILIVRVWNMMLCVLHSTGKYQKFKTPVDHQARLAGLAGLGVTVTVSVDDPR